MRVDFVMILGLLIWAIPGCTSIQCGANKGQFIEQYERFMSEVMTEEMRVTDSKWTIYDDQIRIYLMECYAAFKDELSTSDKSTVINSALRYHFKRYGSEMVGELTNSENPLSVFILDEMHELWQTNDEAFQLLLREEWDELTKSFVNDLKTLEKNMLDGKISDQIEE